QGHLMWFTERHAEAAAAYRQAINMREGVVRELPDVSLYVRELAILLATCPERELRDKGRVVELANQTVRLAPDESASWYTLAVAQYMTGNWPGALAALDKTSAKSSGDDNLAWFVRAMTLRQMSGSPGLGDEQRAQLDSEAQEWYARAVALLQKTRPVSDEPRRLHEEAAELFQASVLPNPNN
ncbi:MAG TPA: hypothetical protein VKH44_11755, partial [Pirellulaceae bacterium]|nr:hypothetical protein [Pirellulaceae bacterium]